MPSPEALVILQSITLSYEDAVSVKIEAVPSIEILTSRLTSNV